MRSYFWSLSPIRECNLVGESDCLLVDIPETVKPNAKVQQYGLEASERTKELWSTASEITFEYDDVDRTDRYDRTLGYIFVKGTLIQEMLARDGLARVAYVREPNIKYLPQLEKAQEQAQSQLFGIWSIKSDDCFCNISFIAE